LTEFGKLLWTFVIEAAGIKHVLRFSDEKPIGV